MINSPTELSTLTRLRRSATRTATVSTAILAAISLALGSALAAATSNPLTVTVMFGAQTLAFFAIALVCFARSLPKHLPHERLGPANVVTLIRLLLVALLAGMLGQSAWFAEWLAVGLATVALLLDGLDGWLARRGGWSSSFGASVDMETDALLILLLSCLVWQFDKAGPWILLAGVIRYVFVTAGFALTWLRASLEPSFRRKLVCVIQAGSLLIALTPLMPSPWSDAVALIGLITLVYSFSVDIFWLRCQRHRCTP